MNVLMLINEASGAVQSIGVEEVEKIAAQAASNHTVSLETISGEAEALIEIATQRKDVDVIAAAGGDGTQAAIAGALLNRDTALLPLPCGTMNMLCRDLDTPLDIEEALNAGLAGDRQRIDVGKIDDRVFLNNVVFGAYAELAEAREEIRDADNLADISFGLVAAANAFLHADARPFRIDIDGKPMQLDTNTVGVSNNAISHAQNFLPQRRRLDAGKLFAYLPRALDGVDFAAMLAEFARGDAEDSDDILVLSGSKMSVDAAGNEFFYSVDGDPLTSTAAVSLSIEARALIVMTPAPS